MGYYTKYSLNVIGEEQSIPDSFKEEAKKYGINIPEQINHEEAIGHHSGYWNPFLDSVKWYNHNRDMREYSMLHPHLVFRLLGEGEGHGDLWVKYYKDGKVQECKAKIIYDDFDESKLI